MKYFSSTIKCLFAFNANFLCAVMWRLSGGKRPNEGSLEVYYNGVWGTVCSSFWDIKDSTVACRSLGLPPATYVLWRTIDKFRSSTQWLTRFRCTGNESSLSECPHAGWGNTASWCRRSAYVAGVVCGYPSGMSEVNRSGTRTSRHFAALADLWVNASAHP